MKKSLAIILFVGIILAGCTVFDNSSETKIKNNNEVISEDITINTISTNRLWEGSLVIDSGDSITKESATLKIKYTGKNEDILERDSINVSLIEINGENLKKLSDVLKEDNTLDFDLSNQDISSKLRTYAPLAFHVKWKEEGKDQIESLKFSIDAKE